MLGKFLVIPRSSFIWFSGFSPELFLLCLSTGEAIQGDIPPIHCAEVDTKGFEIYGRPDDERSVPGRRKFNGLSRERPVGS